MLNIQFAELDVILPANKLLQKIALYILDKHVDTVLVQTRRDLESCSGYCGSDYERYI